MIISVQALLYLFMVATVASFIDAIAGGGGLITLPALLLSGLDPVSAVATNKLQASVGGISATLTLAKKKLINWHSVLPIALTSMLGSCLGALSINFVPKSILLIFVPILLVVVIVYFSLAPKINYEDRPAKLAVFTFSLSIVPMLGFYDGVFGPGVGAFFMLAFSSLLGFGMIKAIAHTKVANMSSNLGALGIFMIKGSVIFPIGLTMAAGSFIGSKIGILCAVKLGAHIIKPLLIIMCLVMIIKLLAQNNSPMHTWFVSLL
jgi:uncharacterized protein